MQIANALMIIAALSLFLFLLRPLAAKLRSRWTTFLPSISAAALLAQIISSGLQAVLLGLYLFSLVIFLASLGRLRSGATAEPRRRGRAVAFGLAGAVLLAVCLIPPLLLPIAYAIETPSGPFSVGTVTYGWEDDSRLETFTPDPADHRKIAVQLWYPVDAAQGNRQGEVVSDAPVSAAQPRYPLVVFSHGAYGVRSSNTTTYKELASQGYIVASIDHAYHAFFTSFPDGERALISQQFLGEVQANQSGQVSEAENYEITFGWLELRTADIRFTLDQIEALNETASQSLFAGRVDLDKIGLFGHSLGGAASAAVCREDARCKAAVVIDATMFGEYRQDQRDGTFIEDPFPQPLLIFYNGDTYHATANHLGYLPDLNAFEHAAGPAYGVVINGAQHLNFTDLPTRAPVLARLLGKMMAVNGGTAGKIQQARCMEILNRYVLDFFDQALRDKPSELLAGEPVFEEVEFSASAGQ